VKPGNIIKVKHYMHNGLRIYQTKKVLYCRNTFLAFPRLACLICSLLVMGKTVLLHRKPQQANYYFRFATKPWKAYQYQL